MSMMANIDNWLAIQNHQENIPVSVSLRVFPERLNFRGKVHPECGQLHLLGWGPRLNEKRVTRAWPSLPASLLWMRSDYSCPAIPEE